MRSEKLRPLNAVSIFKKSAAQKPPPVETSDKNHNNFRAKEGGITTRPPFLRGVIARGNNYLFTELLLGYCAT